MSPTATIHASAAVVRDRGVIIRGESGNGKSSLLLALVSDDERANALVADDRVVVSSHHGRLVAAAPPELAGLIEVRGQGILRRPYVSPAVIDLVVDLLPPANSPRMPDPDERAEVAGIILPRLVLPAGGGDGALRVRVALRDRFGRAPASQPLALRS